MDIFNKKIILASQSPRRKQLLEEAGFQFEVKVKDVAEDYPEDLPVDEVAEFLAIKKAHASKASLSKGEIIIAADCIVVLNDKVYGKPANEDEAFRALKELSGKSHKVISGVCLLSTEKQHTFSGVSIVHMSRLTDEEIWYYIKKFQPFDKAGSYAIQEWIGLCLIDKIEGTYSNIMGLPMNLVYKALKEF